MTPTEISKALQKPFLYDDIEFKIKQLFPDRDGKGDHKAIVVAYIRNIAVMERLDEVFGIDGWQNSFEFVDTVNKQQKLVKNMICKISVKIGDKWIKKSDGAPMTKFEGFKGGLSDSFKRTGVHFGIGRYLRKLPQLWVHISHDKPSINPDNIHFINDKENNIRGYWISPKLPKYALPQIEDDLPKAISTDKKLSVINNQLPAHLKNIAIEIIQISNDMQRDGYITSTINDFFVKKVYESKTENEIVFIKQQLATLNSIYKAYKDTLINKEQYIKYLNIIKSNDVNAQSLEQILSEINKFEKNSNNDISHLIDNHRQKIEEIIEVLANLDYDQYSNPKRILNSHIKNLGVDDIYICDDINKLEKYLDKLQTKIMIAKKEIDNQKINEIKKEVETNEKEKIFNNAIPDKNKNNNSSGIILGE